MSRGHTSHNKCRKSFRYTSQCKPGAYQDGCDTQDSIPMPRGRLAGGGAWMWKPGPPGPVALMPQSAATHTARITTEYNVILPNTQEFNIIEAPIHYAKMAIYMISEGASFHTVAFNRKSFSGIRKADKQVSLNLINTIPAAPPRMTHNSKATKTRHSTMKGGENGCDTTP